jgi:hypothetical protein
VSDIWSFILAAGQYTATNRQSEKWQAMNNVWGGLLSYRIYVYRHMLLFTAALLATVPLPLSYYIAASLLPLYRCLLLPLYCCLPATVPLPLYCHRTATYVLPLCRCFSATVPLPLCTVPLLLCDCTAAALHCTAASLRLYRCFSALYRCLCTVPLLLSTVSLPLYCTVPSSAQYRCFSALYRCFCTATVPSSAPAHHCTGPTIPHCLSPCADRCPHDIL